MPKKNEPVLKKEKDDESSPEIDEVDTVTETVATEEVRKETYHEVYFLDQQSDTELPYHFLSVNGEALQVQKGSTVIIPQRFLEVANNAVIPQFKKGRKVGEVSRCPYRIIRDATEAEYLKMKREGTAKHRRELENQSRAAEKSIEA